MAIIVLLTMSPEWIYPRWRLNVPNKRLSTIFMRAFSNFNPNQDVLLDGKVFHGPSVSEEQLRSAFSRGITRLEHKPIELGELAVVGKRDIQDVWFVQIEHSV